MSLATHTSKDPVSKHATTQYNRAQRVFGRMQSIYADCIAYSLSFENYLDKCKELRETGDYKKLTSYYRGKLSGITDTLWSTLYCCIGHNKPLLMSVSIGPDGRMFVEGDDSWLAEDTAYKNNMQCHHIWREPYVQRNEIRMWS